MYITIKAEYRGVLKASSARIGCGPRFFFAAMTCERDDVDRWWLKVLKQLLLPVDKRRQELASVVRWQYIVG